MTLRLLLIGLVLACRFPLKAGGVCTPLAEPEVTVELFVDVANPVVGDGIEFTADVRDPRRVPVRKITIELSGWQTRFVSPDGRVLFLGGVDDDPSFPFPELNLHFFAMNHLAAHPGHADVRFAIHYELARGCAEDPYYEPRTTWSAPVSLQVIASTACRGDCDRDHRVTADEIQRLIVAALEGSGNDSCAAAGDPDRSVGVDDLLQATTNALLGCPVPRVCGGIDRTTCPGREWCDFPAGSCGREEAGGICRDRNSDRCYIIHDEGDDLRVCGCDGVTYGDDCERIDAGVALAHPGRCEDVDAAASPRQ